MTLSGGHHLPDGRPILPSPSVPVSEAARLLEASRGEVVALMRSGELKGSASGAGVTLTSINAYARREERRLRQEREARREEVRSEMIRDEIQRRQPAKGYGQLKDGMTGRPSSAGVPTLGRRG